MRTYIIHSINEFSLFQVLKRTTALFIFVLLILNFLFPSVIQSISMENEYATEWTEIDLEEEGENEAEENEEIESDDLFHSITYRSLNTCLINRINYAPCKLPHFYLNKINTPPPEFS